MVTLAVVTWQVLTEGKSDFPCRFCLFFCYFCRMGIKDFFDRSAFGVCSYLGERMGVASARVRMYFIYLSFVALGSPILIYLFGAFWLNVKRYIKRRQDWRWE